MSQQQTVGSMVHYRTNEGLDVAAVITFVNNDETINLCIFQPMGGIGTRLDVRKGNEKGQWNWLPRV